MMADAAGGRLSDFAPVTPGDFQQLAQAYWKAGRLKELAALAQAIPEFPASEGASDASLAIAGYLEKSELIAERDRLLKRALSRYPALAAVVNPVLAGSARLSEQRSVRARRLARQ